MKKERMKEIHEAEQKDRTDRDKERYDARNN